MPDPMISIFHENGGEFERNGPNYSLADFGGIVPAVGDVIVDPGVAHGENRLLPENRNLLMVTARYILPDDQRPAINLVVRDRIGNPHEMSVLGD